MVGLCHFTPGHDMTRVCYINEAVCTYIIVYMVTGVTNYSLRGSEREGENYESLPFLVSGDKKMSKLGCNNLVLGQSVLCWVVGVLCGAWPV